MSAGIECCRIFVHTERRVTVSKWSFATVLRSKTVDIGDGDNEKGK